METEILKMISSLICSSIPNAIGSVKLFFVFMLLFCTYILHARPVFSPDTLMLYIAFQ
jgi:hypothetical protein